MPTPRELARTAMQHLSAQRVEQAEALLRKAAQQAPRDAEINYRMSQLLFLTGRPDQCKYFLEKAIEANPKQASYLADLGSACGMTKDFAGSRRAFERALAIDPACLPALVGLGSTLMKLEDYAEARRVLDRAVATHPASPEALANLAGVLFLTGHVRESTDCLRRAVGLNPRDHETIAKLIANLNYTDRSTPEEMLDGHRQFDRALRASLPIAPGPHPNDRDPDRVLTIGYLSPDMYDHSVSFFFEPLLESRDASAVRNIVYPLNVQRDAASARLERKADAWHDASRLSDKAIVDKVRADKVDILVDLAGHTLAARYRVLLVKPAPIQVSFIGYPNTTGMSSIDYRIVDSITDPPGAERWATEKLVRLDPCFLCYRAWEGAPEPAPPPSRERGSVTFGSFNTSHKITPGVIDAWSRLLERTPGSRLYLKNLRFGDAITRGNFQRWFAERGAGPERVELVGPVPDKGGHLAAYSKIDVALDTFPYAGTTTTCEAMWMGVPVVTLEGSAHAGRVGVSLLRSVGLDDLIAPTPDAYIEAASRLAGDAARLDELRRSLRGRMRGCALCDGPAYVRRVESAYRSMWRAWCAGA